MPAVRILNDFDGQQTIENNMNKSKIQKKKINKTIFKREFYLFIKNYIIFVQINLTLSLITRKK